ncbi:MAG: polyhydroxyalkanoate synthesis repressor PhaR [Alphaproteobacteria bacterium]|nr:polyhydroxyalkanoate synthesis repressor PhaR [Alphaproteobacteria bacterium]
MAAKKSTDSENSEPITIKKYANRRLYNTATSSYVTLDHLCQMVKDGVDFAVHDAKSGDDITRSVLTQIIVEEEAKGQNLLPIGFLRQLISFYGDNMQQMLVPKYLDFTMRSFAENQDKMRGYFEDTFGSVFPFGQFDDVAKQNLAMFEQAMQFFNPAAAGADAPDTLSQGDQGAASGPGPGAVKPPEGDAQIDALQKQIDEMQRQLKTIQKG